MNLKSISIAVIGLCMTLVGHAHNPKLATFCIRNYDAVWMIEGSLAQDGLQTALSKYYHQTLPEPGSASYKKLLAQYVRQHINITTYDGDMIKLGDGAVKLGNHQSDVRFVLENLPRSPENLLVTISVQSENDHHQNILRIPSWKEKYWVLSEENEFEVELIFNEDSTTNKASGFSEGILSLILGLLVVISHYLIEKNKKGSAVFQLDNQTD